MAFSFSFFILIFVLYLAVLGFLLYYCVFADPDTSPMAAWWTIQLPQSAWQTIESICGPHGISALAWMVERFLMIMYLIIVLGCWSIIFTYVYPWIDAQQAYYSSSTLASSSTTTRIDATTASNSIEYYLPVSLVHQSIGILVFLTCMMSWRWASRTSPGVVTPSTWSCYNHYPYDDYMYSHPRKSNNSNNNNQNNSNNNTHRSLKVARSKYDRMKYLHFVPKYDHYCGWVNNTIGEENYRHFLAFLVIHILMCWYGIVIIGCLLYNEVQHRHLFQVSFVDRNTGQEIASNYWIVGQYLLYQFMYPSMVLILIMVMSITLSMFLGYHVYITSCGFTSNEMVKWGQIMKWYRTELKLYQQYCTMQQQQQEQEEQQRSQRNAITTTPTTTTTTPASSSHLASEHIATTSSNTTRTVMHLDDTDDVTCIPLTTAATDVAASNVKGRRNNNNNTTTDTMDQHPSRQKDNNDNIKKGDADHGQDNNNNNLDDSSDTPPIPQHPGPKPINIYHRGFLQNWYDVLYPISIRKKKLLKYKSN
jgi:palmitoyltransferase ZDHHC4